jgi:DNA modification methylase
MNPYYQDDMVTLYHGDNRAVLANMDSDSIDSCVTDPPYELGFMGKGWDGSGIAYDVELWVEVWRVLKPGGHLLAFGGTRTWHRLAVAIEDAGFEVRDSMAWLYGSGFPKSLDVSKAIDKKRDDKQAVARVAEHMLDSLQKSGKSRSEIDAHFGTANVSQYWFSPHRNAQVVPVDKWPWVREWLSIGQELDAEVWRLNGRKGTPGEAWAEREVIGERDVPIGHAFAGDTYGGDSSNQTVDITAPATPAAEQWQGWGTALKPAHEPIVVARKPLIGTVAENVLTHGTGALNIDGCRIGTDGGTKRDGKADQPNDAGWENMRGHGVAEIAAGRWPANVILDESQAAELDRQSGVTTGRIGMTQHGSGTNSVYGTYARTEQSTVTDGTPDTGGASRFFYTAKASKRERPNVDGISHPTVKPIKLMQYLVRLVTPPGGTILEPFAGSGTTLEAATIEGFNSIGIELTDEYLPLIVQRLNRHTNQTLL